MITKIKQRNFQGIKKLELSLGQVNSIIGPTDTGKSSVLRGLRWLCLNRPDGLAFVRMGADFAGVKIEIEGQEITRTKGKTNVYNLECLHQEGGGEGNDFEGSKKASGQIDEAGDNPCLLDRKRLRFEAFGQEVPSPIKEILNVGSVNFQTQFEAPFWIGLSAGQLSKELNGVVDLTLIDSVLHSAATDLKKTKVCCEIGEERLKVIVQRKESLSWVVEADKELEEIEKITSQLQVWESEVNLLERLVQDACAYRTKRRELEEKRKDLDELVAIAEKITEDDIKVLSGLVDSITVTEKMLVKVKVDLERVSKELTSVKSCPVCGGQL